MSDPLSIVASLIGIASVGVKVSISLFALAEAVSTASDRVESIANDISSTCGILNQLRDLIDPPGYTQGTHRTVFNATALTDITTAVHHCQSIFAQVQKQLNRATTQTRRLSSKSNPQIILTRSTNSRITISRAINSTSSNAKIELSRKEKAKWPFLQPQFNELRNDLRDSKSNLLLMVAVANLAMTQRRGPSGSLVDERERREMRATIAMLRRTRTLEMDSSKNEDITDNEVKEKGIKRFVKRLGAWGTGRKHALEDEDGDATDTEGETRGIDLAEATPQDNDTMANPIALSAPPRPVVDETPIKSPDPCLINAPKPDEIPAHNTSNGQIQDEHIIRWRSNIPDPEPINDAPQLASSAPSDAMVDPAGSNVTPKIPILEPSGVIPQTSRANAPALNDISTNNESESNEQVPGVPEVAEFSSHLPQDAETLSSVPKDEDSINLPKKSVQDTLKPEPQSPSTSHGTNVTGILQAWTYSVQSGLTTGNGRCISIVELSMPKASILTLVTPQFNALNALESLNTYQRNMVAWHVQSQGATLLFIDVWGVETMPTIFGEVEIKTLIWVTVAPVRIKTSRDDGAMFGDNPAESPIIPTEEEKPPIKFKDAVGRHFSFPWHLVNKWNGMEELIKQAFRHVEVIGPHVYEGHYDLVGPDGEIILPQVWESIVQPGWRIVMHMWPMPEPPPNIPPPPPPPPPPPSPPPKPVPGSSVPLEQPTSFAFMRSRVPVQREKHAPSSATRPAYYKLQPTMSHARMSMPLYSNKKKGKMAVKKSPKNGDELGVDDLLLKWTQ